VLVARANEWLRQNAHLHAKTCESIEVKGRYDGVVDTNKSCYYEADHSKRRMRNLYIRALRSVRADNGKYIAVTVSAKRIGCHSYDGEQAASTQEGLLVSYFSVSTAGHIPVCPFPWVSESSSNIIWFLGLQESKNPLCSAVVAGPWS